MRKTMLFCSLLCCLLVFTAGSPGSTYAQEALETGGTQAMPAPGHITVNFKDVDVLTVLNYLSEISGVDIIPTPGVEGLVTMRLRDKPWEVALDIVTRNYGFAYSQEGDIIRVMPRTMLQTEDPVTEVIPLNHIMREVEFTKGGDSSNDAEALTVERQEENIQEIMSAIQNMVDSRRGERATYISSVNAIVITAIPAKINKVKEMLSEIDKKSPQILMEAKIIEIVLDDDEQLGVDWNAQITATGANRPTTFPFMNNGTIKVLGKKQRDYYPLSDSFTKYASDFPTIATDSETFEISTDAPTLTNLFTYGTLNFTQFQAVLRMIKDRTDTEILSTPRITTLNNQMATIKVVEKIMLQTTQEAVETASIITVQFEKDEDAREIGVILTVIPHVNDNDEITLNLVPEVSSNLSFTELDVGTSGNQTAIAMRYNTREANTQVRVKDGDTIFIGGLIKDQIAENVSKLPFFGDLLGDIPYIGKLFKYESTIVDKTEIVFFVTVHILKDSKDSIDKSLSRREFNKYKRDSDLARKAKIEMSEMKPVEDVKKGDVEKTKKSDAAEVKKEEPVTVDQENVDRVKKKLHTR